MLISRRLLRCTPGPAFRCRQVGRRAVSQLLAGTRIGPGGSPDAARVPDCDPARGRRAPSRFGNASRKRPSSDEVG